MDAALQSLPRQNASPAFHAGYCSSFVWTPIEGYAPMENCHTEDGKEVGWIRPRDLKKTTPESKWGTAADWPGEWQAIPHRYDDEGQPSDWEFSTYQPSYSAAKEWIERGWTNASLAPLPLNDVKLCLPKNNHRSPEPPPPRKLVGVVQEPCAPVAVLFARVDSVYKSLSGCDVWDAERDALKWEGGCPVVAHPPCRAWGTLAHFAKPRNGEKELAIWVVDQVRKYGGVLEHPSRSKLWPVAGLPEPGKRDAAGGWTLPILQWWWGHRAEKATRLYICGCEPSELPPIPYRIGEAECMISGDRRKSGKPGLSQNNRERTPPAFAAWLVEVARICRGNDEMRDRHLKQTQPEKETSK